MQKKLIAAAVAGLLAIPALAQTNVTISGRAVAGWESYKLQDCAAALSCNNESRVSDQSSRIIFNVLEDLGGGLKAWAQMDMRYSNDAGGIGMTGNTGLGMMHQSWGKFTIGRWDVHYGEIDGAIGGNRAGSLQTLLGNGIMSQVSGVPAGSGLTTMAVGSRTANLLMWDSPNWNGFTGRLGYSTAFGNGASANFEGSGRHATGTPNPGGGSAWTGAVRYNNGPWATGLSYWSGKTEARPVAGASSFDQHSWRAWLGYTFAMGLKLGIAYDKSRVDLAAGDNSRGAWNIPVSYEFGPHKVYAAWAKAGHTSNVANSGATAWNLGYDYAFSKRTSAGVFYTKLNNKSNSYYDLFAIGANGATATGLGQDVRQWYFGMAHNF